MSGGRATIQMNSGKVNLSQSGDVTAVGQGAYEFCEKTFIECKHYADLGIGRFLVCGTGPLAGFWETCCREAARYAKRPLLIARQNLYPTLAITLESAPIFSASPFISIRGDALYGVVVYLFDDVSRFERLKMTRRT